MTGTNDIITVVTDMLLFKCSWFKYWFIKLDLVRVGKFCFHFSRQEPGSVDDWVNVTVSVRVVPETCLDLSAERVSTNKSKASSLID